MCSDDDTDTLSLSWHMGDVCWGMPSAHSHLVACEVLAATLRPVHCRPADQRTASLSAGAVEKQKLVYILNRDAAARLTISSPLEAHKSHTLVYDVVGVDVGFENPMFACLELDYEVGSNWNIQTLNT